MSIFGRAWACGTIQLDYVLPERLGAEYVAEDGSRQCPVTLHRAILGSFERSIGTMIENHGGKFPLWLAPIQVVVAPIASDANDHVQQVASKSRSVGLSVDTDLRNEKINYGTCKHSLAMVRVIAMVGRKEAETGEVALRYLGQEGQTVLSVDNAV